MTSHMYTEDYAQLKSRKLNAPIRAIALVLASFLLGYIVSGIQLTNPYTSKDVSVNVSEDWHGNVMRSNWGR
jgi:hypothetical protein